VAGAGPGGKEVGRVSVRVVPDVTGFGRRLKTALKSETENIDVEIPIGLKEGSVADLAEDAQKAAQNAEASAEAIDVQIQAEKGAARELTASVDAAVAAAERLADEIEIDLDLDTGGFMAGLESFLAAAEATVDDIDVGMNLDVGNILGDIEAVEKAAEALSDIDMDLSVDWSDLGRVAAEVSALSAALPDIDIEMDLEAGNLAADARAAVAAAQAAAGRIEVPVTLDQRVMRRIASQLRSEVNALARSINARIPIHVDSDSARRALERDLQSIEDRLDRMRNSRVLDLELASNVDRSVDRLRQLNNQLGELEDNFRRSQRPGNMFTRAMQSMASGVGNLLRNIRWTSHGMLIFALIVAFLAPLLAMVSGALISLPGLLAGIALPAAAVALGWEGMKEAAKVLTDEVEQLQATMNKSVQDNFTPIFKQMESIFPMLNREMPKLVEGLAAFSQGFLDAALSEKGMANIEKTIQNTASALAEANPGLRDFTDGILQLVASTSEKFSGLAKWFNKLGDRFKNWINEITTVDESGTTPLERALTGVRDILQGIVDLVAQLFVDGFDLLSDEDMGKTIEDFLDGFSDFVHNTLPAMKNTFEDIAALVKGISDAWNEIEWVVDPSGSFRDMIGRENKDDENFIPDIMGLGALGQAETMIRNLIHIFQTTDWSQTWVNFQTKAMEVMAWIQIRWAEVKAWFSENMPDFGDVWDSLTNSGVFSGLLSEATTTIDSIKNQFASIGPAWDAAMLALPGIASAVWDTVYATVSEYLGNIVSGVAERGGEIVSTVSTWPGEILGALGDLGTLLWDSGVALVQGFVDGILSMIDQVRGAAETIVGAVRAFFPSSPAKEGPFSGRGWVLYSGEAVGEAFAQGISNEQQDVVNTAKALMQATKDVFGEGANLTLNIVMGDYYAGAERAADSMSNAADKVLSSTKSSINKIDDATRQQLDLLGLRADELDMEARRLDMLAQLTDNKYEKQAIEAKADELRQYADDLEMQAKRLEYLTKYGVEMDSILDEIDTAAPEMESKGLTIMERLKKGLQNGWAGVAEELRRMGDDFGEVFGIEDFSGQVEDTFKNSGFEDIPGSVSQQFMSDLGVSGTGFVPTLLKEGATYIFQVNSVDEAMAAKQVQQNKERLQYTRR